MHCSRDEVFIMRDRENSARDTKVANAIGFQITDMKLRWVRQGAEPIGPVNRIILKENDARLAGRREQKNGA